MTIGEYLRKNDIDTYRKLKKVGRKKNIKLGDKAERLMQHRSYKRVKGKMKQVKWG